MSEPTITCPNCRTPIKLTESLAAPLVADVRKRFDQQLAEKESEISGRETAIRSQQLELSRARASLEADLESRLVDERKRIEAEETTKAKQRIELDLGKKDKELAELKDILTEQTSKLAEAQEAQANLIRKERELDDAKREMELNVQKRVQGELEAVRDKTRKETEETAGLKVREKELQILSMQTEIENLKRKAEQGSQQLQGEAQEVALEEMLRAKFPRDIFEPVPKGEFGGDLVQRIVDQSGQSCGSILWETKRTKNWSDGWLKKLRDDQRESKSELAVIVSQALPKGFQNFDCLDAIWVAEPHCALALGLVLRQSLIELSAARRAGEGQQTKAEQVYQYLTGPRFKQRVESIVERFSDMQADLDRERRAMTRGWSKREEQIRAAIESTAGMFGDLQGIAGRQLQEIEGLQLPLLDGPISSDESQD